MPDAFNTDEIRIPKWIKDECVRQKGEFTLRVFSVGGDKFKCNAELVYQVNHLTGVHDSPADAVEDLRARLRKASDDDAMIWGLKECDSTNSRTA